MSTEQTQRDMNYWLSDVGKVHRYSLLLQLAEKIGIVEEFRQVPMLHFQNMSYDQYMINVYAMAKIIAIRNRD